MASKNISLEVYTERRKRIISSIEQKEKLIASEQQKVAKLKEDLSRNDEEYILSLYRTSGQSAVEFVQSVGIANQGITEKEEKNIPVTTSVGNTNSDNPNNSDSNEKNSQSTVEYNRNSTPIYFNRSREDN